MLKDRCIRPIAIFGTKCQPELPDVAIMAEQGFADPEFNTVAWFTLLAPAGTPKSILQRLEKEAVEIIHSTPMKARFLVWPQHLPRSCRLPTTVDDQILPLSIRHR